MRNKRIATYGEGSLGILFKGRKRDALAKGLSWNISRADYKRMTSMNCHYCGSIPASRSYRKGCNGPYFYNGLDRIDSDKGYELDNVIPCCETCNSIKNTLTTEEMYDHITRMIEYRDNPPQYMERYCSPKLRKKFRREAQPKEESPQMELDIVT